MVQNNDYAIDYIDTYLRFTVTSLYKLSRSLCAELPVQAIIENLMRGKIQKIMRSLIHSNSGLVFSCLL